MNSIVEHLLNKKDIFNPSFALSFDISGNLIDEEHPSNIPEIL